MTGTETISTIFVPYGQGRGRGLDATELGVHGVELDRLVALGLPVVPGLTVPVSHATLLARPEVAQAAIDLLAQVAGRRFGDPEHPVLIRLLASTPAGGGVPADLPGLGITAASAPALDEIVGTSQAVYDVFAAAIRYVGEHGAGIPGDDFADAEYDVPGHAERAEAFLALSAAAGCPYPDDPAGQLAQAAQATLRRWASPRARRQRRGQGLPDDLRLALHVQAIRVGPPERCGHGVAESRDPATGAFAPTGTFRRSIRRGTADTRPGEPLDNLPGGGDLLAAALRTLELHLHAAAQVEFEIRDAELALLAARKVERPAPRTAIRLAVDLAEAGIIDDVTAVSSITALDIETLLHPQLQLTGGEAEFARGLPAAAGAAVGRIALSSERAVDWSEKSDPVILVAEETSPGDLPGMLAAKAIVTVRGGLAAHAAVVARGLGRPAVCGATALRIDRGAGTVTSAGHSLAEGDLISVDGSSGTIYAGAVHVVPPRPGSDLEGLLRRADQVRRLGVRTNADNGRDAALAIQYGAEGVGLCRTEHQFLGERLPLVRRYLLATDPAEEAAALVELAAAQKEDFLDLLAVTGNRPVTVRLLDAPLHEFLGESAHEVNPMLGLRGVRLALLRTELYPAQARALFGAWVDIAATGVEPQLEVMVPLVALAGELASAVQSIHRAAAEVEASTGVTVPYTVGTMVETPRAALIAGQLAAIAQFMSFGTNDLTQLTYGFSRDDVEAQLLTAYVERQLLPVSPFASLDPDGVGELLKTAVAAARRVNPAIKLGICGEHGGDPASIELCERLGLDYVSCSPSRVPAARLAAAHAVVAVSKT
ncbi:MAG TPA: putative PEP-binding protein [Streptosporangiaceae bacterium]|nr:putative PEP-binding protein [Streptosporangiaceae bacterium]